MTVRICLFIITTHMTNALPISEPNMMMKYAMVLITCSVGESGSYLHCGVVRNDAELKFVKLSLVFVVIFGEESAIDKKKVRRIFLDSAILR